MPQMLEFVPCGQQTKNQNFAPEHKDMNIFVVQIFTRPIVSNYQYYGYHDAPLV